MRKITSLLMLLCMFVGTAWAQNLVADKAYYLKLKDADLFIDIKNGVNETSGQTITVSAKPVSAYFTASGDGWTISTEPGNKGNFLKVNKWCANPCMAESSVWTVTESDGAYVLSQSEYKGNSDPNRVYLGNDGGFSAGTKLFTDQFIAKAVRFEFIEASQYTDKSALKAKISEYKSPLGRIDLQTSDPKGAFYLSATTDADGNTIDKMIDGKADTFYGSTWGAAVGYFHYWQVDLVDASALPEFEFAYITRANGSDSPTKIVVKGSKDGVEFTEITSLTSLPTNGGVSYRSAKVDNSEGYLHIRFEVPSTGNNYHPGGKEEVTIALAEFALFKTEAYYSDVDKYILSQVKKAQEVVDDENASQAKVDDALAALIDAMERTVKYSFQYGGVEKFSQTAKVMYGDEFPAFTVLPIGVLGTKPEGIVTEDITKVIPVSIDNSKLPFVAAKDYNSIEHWYYMKIRDDGPTYAYYDSTIDYIKADASAYDKKSKDVYSWAFIGNPIDGFSVVNRAAGATKVLSSPKAPTGNKNAGELARMVEPAAEYAGNLVWTVMNPIHDNAPKGSFYLQHPTASAYAINRQGFNSVNSLCYWDKRDLGSSFQIVERQMGALADLEDLLTDANALLTTVNANVGTKIGEYTQATADALTTAIKTANGIVEAENATADDVANLQAAMDAVKKNLPTPGNYYQIHSSLAAFTEEKAVYSDGTQPKWKTLNSDDMSFYWEAVATDDGGVAFKNAKDGKILTGAEWDSQWTMAADVSDASKLDVKIFSKDVNEKGYEYGFILNGYQMHCVGHTDGKGESGNVVSWNTDAANSASSWYVVEVELPVFYNVTYNFVYNKEVKFTQTVKIKEGGAYPEVVVPFVPYGISAANATKPEGKVSEDVVVTFNLITEKELAVKAAANVESIDTWYFMQMHGNTNMRAYIEDNGGAVVDWNDKSVADEEIESHLWGFVGDVFGMKMVNKKTGKAIASTGSGNATMAEVASATAFVVTASRHQSDPWFCMKYPDPDNNNYLNAQGDHSKGEGCIKHYDDNDNGSSFFATEYNKVYEVNVNEYATLFLGSQVAIPEGVKAYVVSETTNASAKMTEVTGSLPAYTAVILKGNGEYNFVTSADAPATIASNKLRGTVVNTYVGNGAYVLAKPTIDEVAQPVGFYKAELNKNAEGAEGDSHFLNNANKAYLPASAVTGNARFISFDFGTETAIDELKGENGNVKAVVYDLSGRRVQSAQKGIFIVNGKKVIK